ncbi:MAG: winged helix-turn-helix transcriptional regulator [Bacteroidales bacterium]|nr:winged helix-turn-helix transcriptional regulator [Bacteroidales bacterium]
MKNFCKLKEIYKVIYNLEAQVQKELGLTINECILLCTLKKLEKSASELAECISQSKSRTSKILSSIEKKGFIERDFDKIDKRKTNFKLTAQGREKSRELACSNIKIPDFIISDPHSG